MEAPVPAKLSLAKPSPLASRSPNNASPAARREKPTSGFGTLGGTEPSSSSSTAAMEEPTVCPLAAMRARLSRYQRPDHQGVGPTVQISRRRAGGSSAKKTNNAPHRLGGALAGKSASRIDGHTADVQAAAVAAETAAKTAAEEKAAAAAAELAEAHVKNMREMSGIPKDAPSPAAADPAAYQEGDLVEVHSKSQQQWFKGQVLSIVTAQDADVGERWETVGDVRVFYGGGLEKCVDPTDRDSIRHRVAPAPTPAPNNQKQTIQGLQKLLVDVLKEVAMATDPAHRSAAEEMLGEVRAQILAQKMAEGDHMEEVQQHAAAAPAPAAASSAAAHSGGPELVLCQVCWDVPCACKSAGGKRNFQIFADTDPIDLTGATSEDNSAPLTQVAPHTQRHKENNAVSESIVPECWSKVRGEDDSPMAVPLDATNPAHKELWDSIVSHMQEVGDVICIARNEHYDLWESFVQEKRKMLRKLRRSGRWENTPVMTGESSSPESSFPNLRTWNIGSGCYSCESGSSSSAIPQNYCDDDAANVLHERPLFHTTGATTETIFQEGFDSRLSKQGCFGRGIYFSDDPKKCDKYWRGQSDARVMFIAQVLLGEAKVFPRGQNDCSLTREPAHHDSVRGHMSVGDEFVVYQNARAFPMFAVYYTTHGAKSTLKKC
jgi:hypothetical protein